MIAVPILVSVFIHVVLTCVLAPGYYFVSEEELAKLEEARAVEKAGGTPGESGEGPAGGMLEAGVVAGGYSADWRTTFDAVFLGIMVVMFAGLVTWTCLDEPSLFHQPTFWLMCLAKLGIMCVVSMLGGILCRCFCDVDANGYILTNKDSRFKVNYTRKIQHVSAYVIPLLMPSGATGNASLHLIWGDFFTLLGFLLLIKPVRELLPPFMTGRNR
jgi:hypothetical protein